MSCRVDTSPLIAGACVVSAYDGLGITGAALRAATASGGSGPGLLYNDWDAGDDAKEFRALLVTAPSAGTLTLNEDGSFSLVGAPDGTYSLTYRLFVDGADLGTATAAITMGAGGSVFSVAAAGIASTLATGSPSAAFSISSTFAASPGGIASTMAFGAPALSFTVPLTFSLTPIGLASALAFGGANFAATYDVESLLTLAQAQQYLSMALGVELPSFIVEAAIEKAAPYVPAMVDAGYSHADQVMVLCISVALIAAAGMPRRLGNQAAPSGASRGFKYSERDLWALRRSLAALDTAGIMNQAVGPDPTAVAMFMVV